MEQETFQGLVREEGIELDAEVLDEKYKTWKDGRLDLVGSRQCQINMYCMHLLKEGNPDQSAKACSHRFQA